ncbi:MAG: YitT family protein [Bacteroidales bacterium]|nr:YitT family protein [Bacteroidales bacterium]MBQ2104600.1 YitT family protein [Bacteroidales bacterium]MBQ3976207.1 YitT family protein [Bacteroidales bacterium]MBQ3984551.1 YitT family protein [Bacteroidales bacterium]MBQ4168631.1 YitT family protein [Bacteroidales bacterium]
MKRSTARLIWEYLVLTIAAFIFAFAWEGFMIPNGMSAGGMMGLCTVVQYATGGAIPASTSYVVVNAALILAAVLLMGIGFGFKTIYCIAISSLAMSLIASTPALHSIQGQFFYVRESLVIPVLAGVLEATGLGLIIRYGGSTGGTDIVALMINKYWPISLSTVFLISDFVIIFLILFIPEKTFADMIYGLIEIVVFTMFIDTIVGGRRSSYQLLVFSDKYEEIADHIINNMDRGVTLLKGQGWYTKNDRNVLLILISQKQFPALSKVIKDMDPRAFISVTNTHNVFGEGFDEIKTGINRKKKKQDTDGD